MASSVEASGGLAKRRVLVVNASLRAFTEIAGKVASIVLFAFIARKLGEVPLGDYVFALALTQIIYVVADLGMSRYLLQETARDYSFIYGIFYDAVAMKFLASSVATLGAFGLSLAVSGFDARTWLLLLVGASMVCDLTSTVPLSVFIAREEMRYYTFSEIPNKYLQAAIGVVIILLGGGIVDVGVAAFVSSAAALLISAILVARHYPQPGPRIHPRRWLANVRRSGTFGVQDVLSQAVMRIDAVILSLLATAAAVGWYGASYRLIDATLFVTWSVVVSATPMYSYLTDESTPTLSEIYGDSVRLVLAIIVPIAVTLFVCARPIVNFAFGLKNFTPSVLTLQVLAFSPVFYAVSNQAAALMLARGKVRRVIAAFGGALVVNVVANLIFIPIWSYKASAAATLGTEAFLATWCTVSSRSLTPGLPWPRLLAAPVLGAALMGLAMIATHRVLYISLPVGAIVYALVIFLIEVRLLGGSLRPRRAAEEPSTPVPPSEP